MEGSFNVIYYSLSKRIMKHKIEDIESTKADCVATSCMGCLIQLKNGIYGRKMGKDVVHLVMVLEKVMDFSGQTVTTNKPSGQEWRQVTKKNCET